ncbi:MAG: flagellar hook-length control protein FliK, partial [Hansschlegelia sp.]
AAQSAANASRRTRLEVRLDENDLGRIDVRMDISQDGRVATRLTVDRPETLAMLRNDASELAKNLQQAGFTMNGGGLSFELRDGGQQGWGQRGEQQQAAPIYPTAEAENDLVTADPAAAYRGTRSSTSALDVRV